MSCKVWNEFLPTYLVDILINLPWRRNTSSTSWPSCNSCSSLGWFSTYRRACLEQPRWSFLGHMVDSQGVQLLPASTLMSLFLEGVMGKGPHPSAGQLVSRPPMWPPRSFSAGHLPSPSSPACTAQHHGYLQQNSSAAPSLVASGLGSTGIFFPTSWQCRSSGTVPSIGSCWPFTTALGISATCLK
jgi:hypothetical protein